MKGINETPEDRLTNGETNSLGYIWEKIKQGKTPFIFAIFILSSISFALDSTALSLANQSFCDNFGDGGSCDRGYNANWVQIATMEADEVWLVSGTNATIENDTTHFKEGAAGKKITDWNYSTQLMRRVLPSNISLDAYSNITVWVYTNWSNVAQTNSIRLYSNDTNYFRLTNVGCPATGVAWCYINKAKTEAGSVGTPTWSNINTIGLTIYAINGSVDATFDDLQAVGANGQFNDTMNNRIDLIPVTNTYFEIQNTSSGKQVRQLDQRGSSYSRLCTVANYTNFTATVTIDATPTDNADTGISFRRTATGSNENTFWYRGLNNDWQLLKDVSSINTSNTTQIGNGNKATITIVVSGTSVKTYWNGSLMYSYDNLTERAGSVCLISYDGGYTSTWDNLLIQSHIPPAVNTTDNSGTFTRSQALEVSALTNSTDGEIVNDWYNNSVAYYTAPRMVAYYPFDAPYSNSTFTQDMAITPTANATVSGATWTSNGKIAGAYSFTPNNYINTSVTISNTTDFTLVAWIKPLSITGGETIFSSSADTKLQAYFQSSSWIRFRLNNGSDVFCEAQSLTGIIGNWTHVAFSRNSTNMGIYINGAFKSPCVFTNTLSATITPRIGANAGLSAGFNGSIDEVRIYNVSLTPSEIMDIYRNNPLGNTLDVSTATESGVYYSVMTSLLGTATSENVTLRGMLNVTAGTGGTAIGNTSGFTVPSNQTINATASALYAFSNWSVTTGNCTVNNATNANTAVQVNDITQCTVQANFISACGVISTPMNYTLLNNVSITNSTCFNVTAANVSIDCNGYSMTGSNTTFKYGIFSNQFNTTIRNCNISNFDSAIVFYQSNNSSVTNSTLKTTCRQTASGIYPNLMSSGINLQQASYNTITNVTAEGYRGISLDVGANWNVGKNLILTAYFDPALSLQCTVSNNTFSNFITYSQDATGQSFGIAVNTGSDNKFYNFTLYNATDNLILEDVCTAYGGGNTKNNLFVNGTLISATKHLITYYAGTKTNNTFYWMNFSATTGNYVQNDPGGNWYNSSTEGNIYPDVQNGTTAIYGNVSSSFNPSFYIGIIGAKYPYNRTNSYGNKVSSTVTDWHPLTPYLILLANLTVNSGLGGTATGNNTSVITPINLSISATPSINYSFSNWSIINGTCTILNTSSNVTNVSITTNETCMVLASFLLNRYGTLTVLCGDGGYNCTGNSTDFIVPSNQTVSATSLSNFTFSYWTTVGNCSVISATTIQVDNGTCVATATFVYSTAYSNITPSPVLSSGLATCTYYYVSSNASNISVEFEWYKNFYLLLSGTATASPNISNTISSINNSSFAYDDLLLCQVRAIGGTWVPSSVVVVKTAVSPITTYSIPALISMFWNTWSWLFVAIFCLGISYIIFQPQIHTTMLSAGLLSFVAFAMTASVNQTNMTFIYEAIAYFALGLVLRFSGSK